MIIIVKKSTKIVKNKWEKIAQERNHNFKKAKEIITKKFQIEAQELKNKFHEANQVNRDRWEMLKMNQFIGEMEWSSTTKLNIDQLDRKCKCLFQITIPAEFSMIV